MAQPMNVEDLRNDDAAGANAFMAYRDSASSQSAAAELEAMFAEDQPVAPAPAPAPAVPAAPATDTTRAVVADVARGVTEIPRAVVTGVRDAAQDRFSGKP